MLNRGVFNASVLKPSQLDLRLTSEPEKVVELPHSPFFDVPKRRYRNTVSVAGVSARSALTNTPKLAAPNSVCAGLAQFERVQVTLEMRFSSVRVRAESDASRARRQYQRGRADSIGFVWPRDDEAANACRARFERMAAKTQGKIKGFSDRSRLRLQAAAAELDATGVKSDIMVTLTYPGDFKKVCTSGKQAKQHLAAYRRRLTRYLKKHGLTFSALWFLEFQDRGAPHFHLILFGPSLGLLDMRRFKAWSKVAWAQVVAHPHRGDYTRHRKRGSHAAPMRKRHFGYAAKYASKAKQKQVPFGFDDVGRFWGVWNHKWFPPYVAVLQVPIKHMQGLSFQLFKAIKDKSIGYANRMLARFEVHELREFRNMSASAVVFGPEAFKRCSDWIDTVRAEDNNALLVG